MRGGGVSSWHMRFRTKFGLLDCAYLALALLVLVLWLSPGYHRGSLTPGMVALCVVLALQRMASRALIYWEIASDGLHERRLWIQRTIPWTEIHSVAPWPEQKPSSGEVAIGFVRDAPLPKPGQVIANPGDMDSFVKALREHAPQARFDGMAAQRLAPQS